MLEIGDGLLGVVLVYRKIFLGQVVDILSALKNRRFKASCRGRIFGLT
jgi:hypothetical protein